MENISMKDVEKEVAAVRAAKAGHRNMTQEVRESLENLGFEFAELGTGSSAYITSGIIDVMNIRSMKYLNGKYLVVGIASHGFSKFGNLYQGYVKKVID